MGFLHWHTFEAADVLDAPAAEVFAVFKDIARWPEWVSVLSAAAPISSGPLRVGFRIEMTPRDLGRSIKTTLIDYEEGRQLGWGMRSPLATLVHTFTFDAIDGRRCRLHHLEYSEGVFGAVSWLLRKKMYACDRQWSDDFVRRFARR